jgi:hypothetical protein
MDSFLAPVCLQIQGIYFQIIAQSKAMVDCSALRSPQYRLHRQDQLRHRKGTKQLHALV